MLNLRTFGGLSLDPNGTLGAGETIPRGRLAILAVLANAGERGLSRDRLLSLFWPDSDEERARGALKQAIFQLRRAAGTEDLFLGTTELSLNPAVIRADVTEFEKAIEAGDLERAATLYAGCYLDGIHLAGNAVFSRWVDQERERLALAHRTTLELLARAAEQRGDPAGAVRWWRQLAQADPVSGSIAAGLMRALAAAGDAPAALRHARVHGVLVREELGAAPDAAVVELERIIREAPRAAAGNGSPIAETPERVPVSGTNETMSSPAPAPAAESRPRLPHRRRTAAMVFALVVAGVVLLWKPLAATIGAIRHRTALGLEVRFDRRFRYWAHAAAMPRVSQSLRELGLGIDAFERHSAAQVGAELSQALTHFTASARLDSTSATPLVWAALAHSWWDHMAQAESVLVELRSSGRRFGSWDRALVDVIQARIAGDLAGSHAASHRLMEVVPESEWALLLAWDALSVGRAREAIDVLNRLDPDRGWLAGEPRYWFGLNVANHLLGDFEAELDAARRALAREPDHRGYIQMEAKALAGLGRVEEVEARCERALTLKAEPRTSDYQPCGQAFVELWAHGHPEAARRIAARLVSEYSTRPDGALDVAFTLLDARDFEGASRALGEHRPDEMENPEYVEVVTWIAAARDDREGAVEGLTRLDSMAERGLGETRTNRRSFRRAEVAALLGDRDEAVSWITRAFREGFHLRTILHADFAFDGLKDYPPFQALQRPVESDEGLAHGSSSNSAKAR